MDRRRRPRTPLLTALLLVSLAAAAAATLSQGCDGGERRALLRSIKPLFVGGEFGYGDAWNESTDCCGWEGVVCGGGGGGHRVVSLSLVQAGIAGAVDGAAFTALQELDLSWNRISAFSLPSAGGERAFQKLSKLSLSHNSLTDEGVAALVINLTTLSELYLGGNQLLTTSWISNLTSLRVVDLSQNFLHGYNGICMTERGAPHRETAQAPLCRFGRGLRVKS